MIQIRCRIRGEALSLLQPLRENIGEGNELDSGTRHGLAGDFRATRADPDNAHAHTIVGAENGRGPAANDPASPATWPRKFRREDIVW